MYARFAGSRLFSNPIFVRFFPLLFSNAIDCDTIISYAERVGPICCVQNARAYSFMHIIVFALIVLDRCVE